MAKKPESLGSKLRKIARVQKSEAEKAANAPLADPAGKAPSKGIPSAEEQRRILDAQPEDEFAKLMQSLPDAPAASSKKPKTRKRGMFRSLRSKVSAFIAPPEDDPVSPSQARASDEQPEQTGPAQRASEPEAMFVGGQPQQRASDDEGDDAPPSAFGAGGGNRNFFDAAASGEVPQAAQPNRNRQANQAPPPVEVNELPSITSEGGSSQTNDILIRILEAIEQLPDAILQTLRGDE